MVLASRKPTGWGGERKKEANNYSRSTLVTSNVTGHGWGERLLEWLQRSVSSDNLALVGSPLLGCGLDRVTHFS